MSLNHVTDQDIVECLQNCPELDGPLFDVNGLDEFSLSDELWANLDLSGPSLTQHDVDMLTREDSGGLAPSQQVFEDVPGLVTPPYSPPTTATATECASPPSSSPPSCSESLSPPFLPSLTQPCPHPQTHPTITPAQQPSLTTTSTSSQSQPCPGTMQPCPATAQPCPAVSTALQPFPAVTATTLQPTLSTTTAHTPILQHRLPQTSASAQVVVTSPSKPPVPQVSGQEAPSCAKALRQTSHVTGVPVSPAAATQLALPHFNGSLQVLKSGETVQIQHVLPQNTIHTTQQPLPTTIKTVVKQEPSPVIGQKRQRPEPVSEPVDVSKLSKKQQRMIKNRESASLSRQKKRQYLDALETRLKEAALKNSTLLQENSSLRKQVSFLEKENESLRMSLSRPSSPAQFSPLKKPAALVMMVVLCFSLSAVYYHRGHLYQTPSLTSPNTALAHVKSRALLSIESDNSLSTYGSANSDLATLPSQELAARVSGALVPVSTSGAELTSDLEERARKWRMRMRSRELPAQKVSTQQICSCPGSGNETRLNLTNIKLINEEMTSCFKLHDAQSHTGSYTPENSLTVLNENTLAQRQIPNYLEDESEKLYRDFKKFIPRDEDSYYLLSFKEHVLLHPPQQNSSHFPHLSIFVPANSDITSLLQMDCEVTSTKIIRHINI